VAHFLETQRRDWKQSGSKWSGKRDKFWHYDKQ